MFYLICMQVFGIKLRAYSIRCRQVCYFLRFTHQCCQCSSQHCTLNSLYILIHWACRNCGIPAMPRSGINSVYEPGAMPLFCFHQEPGSLFELFPYSPPSLKKSLICILILFLSRIHNIRSNAPLVLFSELKKLADQQAVEKTRMVWRFFAR